MTYASPPGARAWSVKEALQALAAHIDNVGASRATEVGPLMSGVRALDEVTGGGLRPGAVTLLDPTMSAQARAVVHAVARTTPYPCLLAAETMSDGARWLLAGESGIPAEFFRIGHLLKEDERAMAAAIDELVDTPIAITDTSSVSDLRGLLEEKHEWMFVLIDDAARFGALSDVLGELRRLAGSICCAVLVNAPGSGDLPPAATDGMCLVTMTSSLLSSRAALVCPDGPDGLAMAELGTDCLRSDAWTLDEDDDVGAL